MFALQFAWVPTNLEGSWLRFATPDPRPQEPRCFVTTVLLRWSFRNGVVYKADARFYSPLLRWMLSHVSQSKSLHFNAFYHCLVPASKVTCLEGVAFIACAKGYGSPRSWVLGFGVNFFGLALDWGFVGDILFLGIRC